MARVFKCDVCGRLEGHEPQNKWLSQQAAVISIERMSDEEEHNKRLDACKQCLTDFETWFKTQKKAE